MLALLTAAFLVPQSTVAAAPQTPNIVVIMADDLGYGDLSCYGAKAIETPHIDALAKRGCRFTKGYCSASTCTPTRYSFLTGTYAFRGERTGIAPPSAPAIIKPGTVTLPSLLQSVGYHTAVIGKWHLGLGDESGPDWNNDLKPGPLEIGFDTCFLLPTTNDRVPQVYVRDHRVLDLDPADPLWVGKKKPSPDHPTGLTHRDELKMDWSHGHNQTIHNGISRIGFYTGGHAARFRDEDLADKWVEQSVAYMTERAEAEQPFFLFFASHDIHVPRMPHERFQGTTSLGYRGDSIAQLDWCVGELTAAIDRLGIADDTLIVFCSDNGPVLDDGYKDGAIEQLGDHDPNGPYRGGKYSVFEGGTRTPFITCWPGHVRRGRSSEMVCTIDLAASLAKLTGATIPSEGCLDSQNVINAMLNQQPAFGRGELVQQDNGSSGTFALVRGDWKLHRYDREKARNVDVAVELANTPQPPFAMYNIADDPEETRDIIEDYPQIATRLKARLNEIIETGRTRPE